MHEPQTKKNCKTTKEHQSNTRVFKCSSWETLYYEDLFYSNVNVLPFPQCFGSVKVCLCIFQVCNSLLFQFWADLSAAGFKNVYNGRPQKISVLASWLLPQTIIDFMLTYSNFFTCWSGKNC